MRLRIFIAAVVFLPGGLSALAQDGAMQIGLLPVPTVTIYPGNTVSADMIAEQSVTIGVAERSSLITSPQAIIGKVVKRTLLAGRVIPANAVAEPDLVNRGAITRAVYAEAGLNITALVLPLQSGALGALIQVRNIDSGRVIAGMVQADGTVRVLRP